MSTPMTTFHFDTSGEVRIPQTPGTFDRVIIWTDLSPFVQGYVEAMLSGAVTLPDDAAYQRWVAEGRRPWCFSDLAPETLARIMDDCRQARGEVEANNTPENGAAFWRMRNDAVAQLFIAKANIGDFPPLTVYLGGDGKVRFR